MRTRRPTPSPAAPRPRGLLVGPLDAGLVEGLQGLLDARLSEPHEALELLPAQPYELVVLDGSLPGDRLPALLRALGPPGRAERPAALIVVRQGLSLPLQGERLGDADDFVSMALGVEGVVGRARAILRFRNCLLEVARKNAELEGLSGRLEVLARRMGDELRLAQRVQRSLLPPPLHDRRLEVARELIPFREVGGDYYDLLPLGPDRYAFAIGDVMGKGVPAALLAANLKAGLRAQLQWGESAPEEVVPRVNRLFGEVTPAGLFASLFYAVLDLASGRLEYVNAGHDYPFRISRDGSLEELREGGAVLGLAERSRYERGALELRQDDVLVFYSDGVTDRVNAAGEMYGVERLKEAALRARGDAARIALYTLLGEAQGWAEGRPADDDLTLVVMRVR